MRKTVKTMLAAAGLLAASGGAQAQVMYGGYNLGPDYGAMIRQQMQLQQQRNQQMQQMESQVVQGAMRDPVCIQHYNAHRAQGGQMAPYQFFYECVRQGRFTAEGRAYAYGVERQNQALEMQKAQELRQAEANRGLAQQQYMAGFQRNNQEFGNVVTGRNTWTDPRNGQQQVLQHTQAGVPTRDPATGQVYVMNNLGQYFVQGPDGRWYPMNPMR